MKIEYLDPQGVVHNCRIISMTPVQGFVIVQSDKTPNPLTVHRDALRQDGQPIDTAALVAFLNGRGSVAPVW